MREPDEYPDGTACVPRPGLVKEYFAGKAQEVKVKEGCPMCGGHNCNCLKKIETTIKDSNPKDAIGSLKAKVSTIPAGVLFDIGNAMLEGMCKYGRHNYRGIGVRSSVYYDAAMGHMMDWWEGEDIDPDSGLSHVTKAIASLVVLRDAMFQDKLHDDRPPRSKVHKRDFSKQSAEIIDRYKHESPKHWTIEDSDADTGK